MRVLIIDLQAVDIDILFCPAGAVCICVVRPSLVWIECVCAYLTPRLVVQQCPNLGLAPTVPSRRSENVQHSPSCAELHFFVRILGAIWKLVCKRTCI